MPTRLARSLPFALIASLTLSACGSNDRSGMKNPDTTPPPPTTGPGPDTGACAKMDLLFIVDDSGSMKEEQGNLAANFPKFIQLLDDFKTSEGAELDYRIGVTTTGRTVTYSMEAPPPFGVIGPMTEVGDDGRLRYKPECGMHNPWVSRGDSDVAGTFACVAQVGTSGPSLEMPLNSIKTSLVDRAADSSNANFLRHDALLAVIILTDEDDCSREDNGFTVPLEGACTQEPVKKYADLLDTIKGGRNRWAAAVIAGPGPGSCMSAFGEATEATRLKDFTSLAGDQAVFSSICAGNLTDALNTAMSKFTAACETFEVL